MRNGSCIGNPIFFSFFHSCLTNRKQFIKCRDQNTDIEVLRCGVPQGSILGPLLFVNDLKNSTKLLDPLFKTVNKELHYVNEWLLAIKLSLNAGKTKYLFFHKPSTCDSIPLRLPTITFSSIEIKRESSVKFTGVIIDENITWNKHIEFVENKISKKYSYII